jgi:hypothetical protein
MKERTLKYIFFGSAFILFLIMLYASSDAGISCDEILHYDHSVAVFNYFASGGTDKAALNTPVTNLKYYGQAYDNVVTIITRLLRVEDVYFFRNLMSSIMGWCTVMMTALFAVWFRNYRTGILVIFLFAVTPAFMGHSYNNLKDIPFAFAYIAGIFFILMIPLALIEEGLVGGLYGSSTYSSPVLLIASLKVFAYSGPPLE